MTLVICEKANAAQRIAQILSNGSAEKTMKGRIAFYGFSKDGKDYSIIGLRGHIINLDYPAEFTSWERTDPKELAKAEPYKKIQEANIANLIKKLVKDDRDVVVATDYDREGELIGVEGLEIAQDVSPELSISRARFSALTAGEVNNAFSNLTQVDYNLSRAAETRQIVDLAWGAVLTRMISVASGRSGKDFLSVGRVQSPTLAIIANRERDIMAFVPEPYWEVVAHIGGKTPFIANSMPQRFKEGDKARAMRDNADKAKEASVTKVKKEEKKDQPPPPFNTTMFLRAASGMGYSVSRVMSIAEDLYTNGFISYPRTDNTVYPKSLDIKEIVQTFEPSSEFGEFAKEILKKGKPKPTKGKKETTDHPPIYPVSLAKKGDMDGPHWRIYELVVRRFFATLGDPAVLGYMKIELELNGERFAASGLKVKSPGWRRYYPYGFSDEKNLPELAEGDRVPKEKVEVLDKETKPPKRFSQGALIQEMEKLGLGTKSTRHEIIQKLYDRGYVEDSPPKPTISGMAVNEALESHANTITKPDMTANLESQMDLIAEGKKDQREVILESQEILIEVIESLTANIKDVGGSIRKALQEQNIVGTCPACGGKLILLRSKWGKRFVGCASFPKCRRTYPIPQKGRVVPMDDPCEYCKTPMVQIRSGRKKPWDVCLNMNCPGRELRSGRGKGTDKSDGKNTSGVDDGEKKDTTQ